MNEKINDVHELYQDLKEKYKQEALDINIFWGSPLFAADRLHRNKRSMETVTNS
jgi:tyrosine-protein phosphatase YwqE